jgi:hypothetical protein
MVNICKYGLIKKQALQPAVKILKTPDNTFLQQKRISGV